MRSRFGSLLLQTALAALLVLGLTAIYRTTTHNLQLLGAHSGFAFLHKQAGFSIAQSLIPFNETSTIGRAFIAALLNTLVLAVTAIIASTMLGVAVGSARLSNNWLAARLGAAYVEIFRNIPVLLQIFFWYFAVLRQLPAIDASWHFVGGIVLNNRGLYFPHVQMSGWAALCAASCFCALGVWMVRRFTGDTPLQRRLLVPLVISLPLIAVWASHAFTVSIQPPVRGRFEYVGAFSLMPEFIALAIGLSMYHASYIAEIVRSGFRSVSPGQAQAAAALGLSAAFTFRRVTFPQALTTILPPLATVYANIFKGTSLAAAIAYPELVSVFVGTVNNLVGQPVEIMGLTLITYVVVSFAIAALLDSYNRRLQRRGAR